MAIERKRLSLLGSRKRRKSKSPKQSSDSSRLLQLEKLEDRQLLDAMGLPVGELHRPFPDGLDHPNPVVRELIANITTTASPAPMYGSPGGASGGNVGGLTLESGPLIGMDRFRADPRFRGIDGTGFATVILDTGIDLNHPFFGPDTTGNGVADRIVFNQDYATGQPNAQDVHGHGSNVSSIVVSSDPTYPGMAPGADIIHLKVLNDQNAGQFAWLEQGLQWVIANAETYNIASVNLSLGDGGNYNSPVTLYGIDDELAALVAMDVIVVSASGNSFGDLNSVPGVGYPSADPNSLSVGAVFDSNLGNNVGGGNAIAFTTGPDRITPFSQRHPTMSTIFAPGAAITGAAPGGGTSTMSGTSMASPHISGIAVLAQQLAERTIGRRLTQAEFVSVMRDSAVTINDGDDEDDNVINTGADFLRVDMVALGQAVMDMGETVAGLGPILGGIQPNDGSLLAMRNVDDDPLGSISVLNVAPRSLTFRFDEPQVIDAATLDGIRIVRSGSDRQFGTENDVQIIPGYIGVGDYPHQNEVIVRFAETLPDDLYRITIFGIDDSAEDIIALRNIHGAAFNDRTADGIDNGSNVTIDFDLQLGPQVIAVVPQPVAHVVDPADPSRMVLQQARNQIRVFFNNDNLFIENDAQGNPTERSAENPAFYQLIYTRDTLNNTDDVVFTPERVVYDPVSDMATLYFADDLGMLIDPETNQPIGSATFRLRIGTDEQAPLPPERIMPQPQVTSDFHTGGAAAAGGIDMTFTARADFARAVNISMTTSNLGQNAAPQVSVSNHTIHIVLNSHSSTPTTAAQLVQAIENHAGANALVGVTWAGDPAADITSGIDDSLHLRVVGLGSSFDTASDLGAITDSQYWLISAAIVAQENLFDMPGSPDEPGQRDLPPEMRREQYVNPSFGPDRVAGITTIMYNFRGDYGFDSQGNPLSNAITDSQKARVREVVELWGQQVGVQFLETPNQGITFVSGDLSALPLGSPSVINEPLANLRVRTDPQFQNSMLIIDSNQSWSDQFGGDWFQRAMIGTGFLLGLQRMNDQPLTNMMAFGAENQQIGGVGSFLGTTPLEGRSVEPKFQGIHDTNRPEIFGVNAVVPEPIFPGVRDIMNAQYVHRLEGKDIDLYRFTLDLQDQDAQQPKKGLLTLETFAERLPNSSLLDTVLSLYREVPIHDASGAITGYDRELIARNDDYYGSDSYIRMELGSGTYFVAVTAAGNTDFDPVIEDTGWGGTSQGAYELRFSFRAEVDQNDAIRDMDRFDQDGQPGTRLDGNADGTPGGVFNFWFQTRPLERMIRLTGDSSSYVDGQTLTIEDAFGTVRRFEFDNNNHLVNPGAIRLDFSDGPSAAMMATRLANAINQSGLNGVTFTLDGTSIQLSGERLAILSSNASGIELDGKTIFVDRTSGVNLNGTLAKPFDRISTAFAAAVPGDIVRIVGNGGLDGNPATIEDNFAYEIGIPEAGTGLTSLRDGQTMDVPKGVTTMIDAGAIFKLRRARIGVGTSNLTSDRSGGALQVLGTPHLVGADGHVIVDDQGQAVPGFVYFTSRMDEQTGQDLTPARTTPAAGDWGGIVFRADLDKAAARPNLESEGIFLNYVNHADIRYGGGLLRIDAIDQVVNPIQILESRPTVTYNRISFSADAAMSADPNSFEESNFHSPQYQRGELFTLDYERIGPEITGNILQNNSINGLFIKIETQPGQPTRRLTVPARFDDTDIVHVISENLIIQGQAGQAILETERPSVQMVTLNSRPGGSLTPGQYTYKLVFVDVQGFEGRPSDATSPGTVAAGHGTLLVQNLTPVSGNYTSRRLYRSEVQPDGSNGPYHFVANLNANDTTFRDTGAVTGALLQRDPPAVGNVALEQRTQPFVVPGLASGDYHYRVLFVDEYGVPGAASDPTAVINVVRPGFGPANRVVVDLTGLPAAPAGFSQQIFRSQPGGSGPYVLAGQIDAGETMFTDNGSTVRDVTGNQVTLDPTLMGVVRARPSARLMIDPGSVIKLEGARIEATFGAQLIAEGYDGQEIIFTSKLDDRYGAGGTFDTNNDGIFGVDAMAAEPQRGQWSGLFIGHLGKLNLDHVYLAYGGGDNSKIEGTFKGFNAIEIHQATARIANSIIEQNDPGTGGQGPNDRFGRGPNEGATIFVRGAQPVLLNNTIRDNAHVAISINVDAFTHDLLPDPGRTSGIIDQATQFGDNRGPLVRGNRIANNGPVGTTGGVGTNGMEMRTAGVLVAPGQPAHGAMISRGITLSTQSVWDDTDIVHILYNEISIPNFNTYGGLRLQSAADESLVVKLYSLPLFGGVGNAINDHYNVYPTMGAGFTATGRLMEIEDRIGGVLHVVGQPGFPVILTSLHDDTVGAGLQPDGRPQTDTNNNGWDTRPSPGDWRSLRMDQFSHDRNVEIILEQEASSEAAPGINSTVQTAQFLGELAASETSGDENYRMGFEIHGFLSSPGDIDVYTFTAQAGTEIWLDIDRTRHALDTVIEVLDSNGRLIALSDSSTRETMDPSLLYNDPSQIADTSVNPLQKLAEQNQPRHASGLIKDHWTTNERDAGMRVLLPGTTGQRSPYTIRVRSSNLAATDPSEQLRDPSRVGDGLTSGVYQLQVRTREKDEVPGSTVRYSEIRYAQNGVELIGLPKHSPLLGEAMEDEWVAEREFGFGNSASNDDALFVTGIGPFVQSISPFNPSNPGQRPQDLGNVLTTDRAVISLAGSLSSATDIDFYRFSVRFDAVNTGTTPYHAALTFDMDYADELGRPDTTITIFRVGTTLGGVPTYTPILIGRDSNIADDRSAPVRTADDLAGVKDLSRGSVGSLDPFVGTVHLPEGDYAVAVTSAGQLPTVLVPQITVIPEPPDDPDDPDDPQPPPPIPPTYAAVRLEPINSVRRIAEDRIGSYGGTTAEPPVVRELLDPTFNGQTVAPGNLWHVSRFEQFTPGHGITAAFDGSRTAQPGGDTFYFGNRTVPNYSIGGGIIPQGDLVSNPFSLKEYSAADKPVMYFNYRLDTAPGDHFRAFIQRPDGTSVLVASSQFSEWQAASVQRLFNDDVWRQVRVELDAFARTEGLRIRYEFAGSTATPGTARGVHIDDVIIGFAERGEMITGAPSTTASNVDAATFTSSGFTPGIASGPYQLEIRRSTPYGTSTPGFFGQSSLALHSTFDTNDRFVPETTLIAPAVTEINDGDTFRLSDGANVVTFEYDSNFQVSSGNIPLRFTAMSQDYQIAAAIRDAINSPAVQSMLRLQATLSDGTASGTASRSNRIVLFGNASGDIYPEGSSMPQSSPHRGIMGIQYDGFGDRNVFRDQGQTLIHSNTILYAADWGIRSEAGPRQAQGTQTSHFTAEARLGSPQPGPARNLRVLNDAETTGLQGGFAPGPVIFNNTIAAGGLGGIHVSGDMAPYELTIRRGLLQSEIAANVPPDDRVDLRNNAAGDAINDGDWFTITVGRTTVEFEFQDMANTGDDNNRRGHLGGSTNPGWVDGRVPVYYRRSLGAPNPIGYSSLEMAWAIKNAIDNSILVHNGTTQVARTFIAPSRSSGIANTGTTGSNDWAVYIEGAREVSVFRAHFSSTVFENVRVAPLAQAPQPFARIVNNTIHGTGGNEASFPGSPAVEPNDTIFNAIDTRQGRATSPETYTANGTIGNNPYLTQMPSADVDMYQFQMDVGDQVIVEVSSNEFVPFLRLFDSVGRDFAANIAGAPFGSPRITSTGNTVRLQFYAEEAGTYFVSVSGTGHTDFSPLSMGNRSEASASGDYSISVNVLAPRTWVIDTRTLVAASQTLRIFDVDNIAYNVVTPGGGSTQDISKALRTQINALPGITAQAYGGWDTRVDLAEREPRGAADWAVRDMVGGTTNYERYIVVHGASRIDGSDANTLWPILGTNNDSGLLPETGILIGNHATPTVMNNVISNNRNGIVETLNQPDVHLSNFFTRGRDMGRNTASEDRFTYPQSYTLSPISAVVGANLFQNNAARQLTVGGVQMVTGNWGISDVQLERPGVPTRLLTEHVIARPDNQDFNIALAGTQPLFVNAADRNYYPAPLSRAIDSAMASLEDRPAFLLVKRPMGLADSPVLAPTKDAVGQLRIDDPAVSPPQGMGQNVFIDRGSLDRSDFIGPWARLTLPRDNDGLGLDIDPTATVVHLVDGVYPRFSIQLVDGFDVADPFPGVGVNGQTVAGPRGAEPRLPGSAVTVFQNGTFLREEVDYSFRYDPISHTIHLIPISGIWPDDAVYEISLNNRDRYVINAPRGDRVQDGDNFQITDGLGTTVTFEFDTGFYFDIPSSLSIQVPREGITDGQRFLIRDASNALNQPVTFEIVFDGRSTDDDNVPVQVQTGFTQDQVAQAIVEAIEQLDESYGLELMPRFVGEGLVHLGAAESITINTERSTLTVPPTILTLAIPVTTNAQGQVVPAVTDGQRFTITVQGAAPESFEFDNNRFWTADNRINITNLTTVDQVGGAIVAALLESDLDLVGVQYVGEGLVHVHVGGQASIDPQDSNVFPAYVSRPLTDGERFTIQYDDGDPATDLVQQVFEFDSDEDVSPDAIRIPFSLFDTHEEIADKTAQAIFRQSQLRLPDAKHLNDGRVYLGGTPMHEVDLTEAPTISPTGRPLGRPEVAPSSTLLLPGFLSVLVPETGGDAIVNRTIFRITDERVSGALQTATFEFITNVGQPGWFGIPFVGTDANQLADNIIAAINAAKTARADVGFLAGVTPTKVVDDDGQVVVELNGTNGFHALDTTTAPNVDQRGGRIGDSTFVLSFEGTQVTFEFDSNQQFVPGNIVIPYSRSTSLNEIAKRIENAIRNNPLLNLPNVVHLGGGVIDLQDTSRHQPPPQINPRDLPPENQVNVTGIPGGAVRLAFEPWDQFTGAQFAQNIIQAINENTAFAGVTASLRGDNTLFVDFRDPVTNAPVDFTRGPASVTGISNYFLRAIQDIPGNWLKANQSTDSTTFTILLPGAKLDYGSAPDSVANPRYPTLLANDGARHVISDPGFYLGSRVDADPNGQPNSAALGDVFDHVIDLGSSPISFTGLAPYVLRVPATGVSAGAWFSVTPAGGSAMEFEFVDAASPHDPSPRVPIEINSTWPTAQRANLTVAAMISSIQSQPSLGLAPVRIGEDVVSLGASFQHRVDTRGTALSTSGQPTTLLHAVAGMELRDGQRFTIHDGRHPAVTFQFTSGGAVPFGVQAVPFQETDDVEQIAQAILQAVESLPNPNWALGSLDVTLTDLGDGRLHVAGRASHQVDLADSGLVFSGHTPAQLTTRAAGLGLRMAPSQSILMQNVLAGGVLAGQRFTINDGKNLPVTFEFTSNGVTSIGNIPITWSALDSSSKVANAVVAAIQTAVDEGRLEGVAPQLMPVGSGPLEIRLNSGLFHRVDTSASGLSQRGPVTAGQLFRITDGDDLQRTFQFVLNAADAVPDNVPIVFQDDYTPNQLANAIVLAVQGVKDGGVWGGDLQPLNFANGNVQIGGGGAVTVVNASNLTAMGVPNGILDGQTFTVNNGIGVRQFEFDANGKSTPGNAVIRYGLEDDATTMAEKILARIEQEGYAWDLVSLGDGLMRIEGHDVDGVFVDGVLVPGATVTLLVTASKPGYLDGWIDFNNDGDFLDQFEHVFASYPLQAGINEVPLTIPATASIGPRFARFRLSSQGGLAPTGLAVDGEVEDYLLHIYSNNPPVVTVPMGVEVEEDVASSITGISVFDKDAGTSNIEVTISVLRGTLSVDPWVVGGVSIPGIEYLADNRGVILTGSQAQINTTLAADNGLIYTGDLNFNGYDLMTVVADDLGNTGTGGPWQDRQTIPMTVLPVNDPPVITLPDASQLQVDEDQPLSITGVKVTDVDVLEGDPDREDYGVLTVVLAVEALAAETAPGTPSTLAGTLAVAAGISGGLPADAIHYSEDGVTWTDWTPEGSASYVRLRGLQEHINTTLDTNDAVIFQGAQNVYGLVLLRVMADDGGQYPPDRGESTSEASQTITIASINDPPVATVPQELNANRNRSLNMAGFDVADVDSGPFAIIVTLTVDEGRLRFVDTSALNLAPGQDTITPAALTAEGAETVTITAPVARLSALLSDASAWQYVPESGFVGESNLSMIVNDSGHTGNVRDPDTGELVPKVWEVEASVAIQVLDINEPPEITAPTQATVDEDQWLSFTGGNSVSVYDPELALGLGDGSGTIRVTIAAESGVVRTDSAGPAVSIILEGTLEHVNNRLATLQFRGNPNFNGTALVTILADDLGNWPPPAQQTTHTVTVTVDAVNDPPVITMPGPLSVLENRSLVIPSISVTDVDILEGDPTRPNYGVLTVVLSVAADSAANSGTLLVAAGVPGGLPASAIEYSTDGTTWNATAPARYVRLTGTQGPLNTTLSSANGVVFTGAPDDYGTVQLTVFADDGGQWPPDKGQSTSEATQTITIMPNRPVVANPVGDLQATQGDPDRLIELYPGVFDYAGNDQLSFSVVVSPDQPRLVEATIEGTILRLRFLTEPGGDDTIDSTVSVTATDGRHSATDTFIVSVTQTPEAPFVANPFELPPYLLGTTQDIVDLSGVFGPDQSQLVLAYVDTDDNTNQNLVNGQLLPNDQLRLNFVSGQLGRAVLTVHATDPRISGPEATVSFSFSVEVRAAPIAQDIQTQTQMQRPVSVLVTANKTIELLGTTDPNLLETDDYRVQVTQQTVGTDIQYTMVYTPKGSHWTKGHPRPSEQPDRPADTFQYRLIRNSDGFQSGAGTVSVDVTWRPLYQNPFLHEDVNGDGFVSPVDALILINYLNDLTTQGGKLPDELNPNNPLYPPDTPYLDVRGNGVVTPADVLQVINYLNNDFNSLDGNDEGEGEAAFDSVVSFASQPMLASPLLVVPADAQTVSVSPSTERGGHSSIGDLQPAQASTDASIVWNTLTEDRSREDQFAQLARQSGSLIDQTLDDLLDDVVAELDDRLADALATDRALGDWA